LALTAGIVLSCLSFSLAQGIQGNITLSGNVTAVVTGHSVTLTWTACQNASSYNIYRGNAHGGPYVKVASGISSASYNDVQVTRSQTLYYVTTAVSGGNESGYSDEAVAVVP
jgi:fibronectin type 3 domain-containing protein